MAVEVLATFHKALHVGLLDALNRYTAVHLQSLCGGNDDSKLGLQTALAAFDVEELLGTEVSTEAGFCHYIVTVGHGHACGDDGVAAMGYVGERATMHEGRGLLGSLHQVWLDGVQKEHCDSSVHTHVLHTERRVVHLDAQNDVANAAAQVVNVLGKAEDSHDFRGGGDVESRLGDESV